MDAENRTFHNDPTSPYAIPNDLPEHSRLDDQAKHVSAVMHHRILHSPIAIREGMRMLDIGCGTGYVADTFALQFPSAEVYGLDLSPVPYRSGRGRNVHFLLGNILTQPPSTWKAGKDEGVSFLPDAGAFDLVFSRFLVAGISDWSAFIATEFRLLRSGGWAEIQDLDPIVYNAADEPVSEQADWHTIPAKASAAALGLDYKCARLAAERMEAAGFVEVTVHEYPLPLGGEGEATPELRAAGDFFAPTMTDVRDLMIRKHVKQSAEDEEKMVAEMRRDMAPAPGKHYKIVVTCGRKP